MALIPYLLFYVLIMEGIKTQNMDACFCSIAYLNINNVIYLNVILDYLLSEGIIIYVLYPIASNHHKSAINKTF